MRIHRALMLQVFKSQKSIIIVVKIIIINTAVVIIIIIIIITTTTTTTTIIIIAAAGPARGRGVGCVGEARLFGVAAHWASAC